MLFGMNLVFLSIGSNSHDAPEQLRKVVGEIQTWKGTEIVSVSSVYKTRPWGKTDQPDFHNGAVLLMTSQKPSELMSTILQTEQKMGRKRVEKWGPRKIDVDIIYYGNEIVKEDGLIIPHPERLGRMFVLVPLCDLDEEWTDPETGTSLAELLEECPDQDVPELTEENLA